MRAIVLLCCAVVSLSACQKSADETATEAILEKATGQKVEVDRQGEQITIRSDQGDIKMRSGAGVSLPAAFPKDVYVPRDYKVASVMEVAESMTIALHAPGDVATVLAEASDSMQRNGWKQVMKMQGDAQSAMLVYEKDKRIASMSLATENDQVTIALQLGAEKK